MDERGTKLTRRGVLRTCGLVGIGGLAGCSGDGGGSTDGGTDEPRTTAAGPAATERDDTTTASGGSHGGTVGDRDPIESPSVAGTWSNERYDAAGSCIAPDVSGPEPPLAELWRREINAEDYPRPVVRDGVLYLSTGNGILAIDGQSGDELWSQTGERLSGSQTTIAVSDDAVYTPADGIIAYDRESGEQLWSEDLLTSDPIRLGDGKVYSPTDVGAVCVDADSGERLWEDVIGDEDEALSNQYRGLSVAGEYLYGHDADGRVLTTDPENGDRIGVYEDGFEDEFITILGDDGTVFVTDTMSETVRAVDGESGEVLWTRDSSNPGFAGLYDGTLYVASNLDTMYALDAESGDDVQGGELGTNASIYITTPPFGTAERFYVWASAEEETMHTIDLSSGEATEIPIDADWGMLVPTEDVLFHVSETELVALAPAA